MTDTKQAEQPEQPQQPKQRACISSLQSSSAPESATSDAVTHMRSLLKSFVCVLPSLVKSALQAKYGSTQSMTDDYLEIAVRAAEEAFNTYLDSSLFAEACVLAAQTGEVKPDSCERAFRLVAETMNIDVQDYTLPNTMKESILSSVSNHLSTCSDLKQKIVDVVLSIRNTENLQAQEPQ